MDPRNGKLLAVFAHPDDEAFGIAGSFAKYAALGTELNLVVATKGEAGEIANPEVKNDRPMGEIREQEMLCASEAIGLKNLIFLDYCDSGMADAHENGSPLSFINAPADEVIRKIVCIIRDLKPDILITFEPQGIYGHPDHIAIHNYASAAFVAAGMSGSYPDCGKPWQPRRLFYNALSQSFIDQVKKEMLEAGLDAQGFSAFDAWPDENIHLTMDVEDWVNAKWEALTCHASQFGPENPFRKIPLQSAKRILGKEYFILAKPEPAKGETLCGFFDKIDE